MSQTNELCNQTSNLKDVRSTPHAPVKVLVCSLMCPYWIEIWGKSPFLRHGIIGGYFIPDVGISSKLLVSYRMEKNVNIVSGIRNNLPEQAIIMT